MSEPKYVVQTGEALTPEESRAWIQKRVDEAKAEGCRYFRASHNEKPFALLVEGWEERPEDEGPQRWSFVYA